MIQTLLAGVLPFVLVIQSMFADENRKFTAITASQEPAPPGLRVGGAAKPIPFSGEVVCESAQTLADGNRIVNQTKAMIYRDGNGRIRREITQKLKDADSGDVREYKTILVSDPSGGQNFSLDPQKRTAVKFPAPVKAIEDIKGSQTAGSLGGIAAGNLCGPGPGRPGFPLSAIGGINEPLGTQLIDGRAADGTRTTYTIPARMVENERSIEITRERWYSKELQLDLLIKTIDPRHGETTQQLTNINQGEPDHSLFEIPSDYTVREMKSPASGSAGTQAGGSGGQITSLSFEPQSDSLSPTIISQEKAKYTEDALQKGTEGTVVLSVIFAADGRITSIRVVRGLPYGLTEKAIEAAIKIRFKPALKDGNPVSVRGNIEFSFSLEK